MNVSKNDSLPSDWLPTAYPDKVQRQAVLDRHLIDKVPTTVLEFLDFYEARRSRLRQRLTTLLSS